MIKHSFFTVTGALSNGNLHYRSGEFYFCRSFNNDVDEPVCSFAQLPVFCEEFPSIDCVVYDYPGTDIWKGKTNRIDTVRVILENRVKEKIISRIRKWTNDHEFDVIYRSTYDYWMNYLEKTPPKKMRLRVRGAFVDVDRVGVVCTSKPLMRIEVNTERMVNTLMQNFPIEYSEEAWEN